MVSNPCDVSIHFYRYGMVRYGIVMVLYGTVRYIIILFFKTVCNIIAVMSVQYSGVQCIKYRYRYFKGKFPWYRLMPICSLISIGTPVK